MKVLLVAPPIVDMLDGRLQVVGVDAIRECPPLGIYTLAAVLEAEGHQVTVADLVLQGTWALDAFAADVDAADLIGIGATSMAWPAAVDAIAQVRRRRSDVPIVCGGIHPTLFDGHVLRTFPVQFVVRGEGEIALARLCAALAGRLPLADVPNLSWTGADGELVRNATDATIAARDLAATPLPRWDCLPPATYKCLAVESSRGCAYDCSFCSTPYRRSWRGLDPEAVVLRLEHALDHLDRARSGCVHIVDDEFSMNPRRATAIARRIAARGLTPRLLYDSRAPDLLHPDFVAAIAPYTAGLLIGAECGYDEGLEKVGKGTTCRSLEQAARVLAQHGLAARTDFSFILGLPWETRAEVEQTIRFATRLFVEHGVHVMLQWYRQIPGSRIWDAARRDGLVHESMYDAYGFFGNLALFQTSCRLTPGEIYAIADMTEQLRWLAELTGRRRPSIVHHFPGPIADAFPRDGAGRLEGVRS